MLNKNRVNSSTGRERNNNEWFTPLEVTTALLDNFLDPEDYKDSTKRILEPAAGEGHMIEAIIQWLIDNCGHDRMTAESMIHAYELEPDNCEVIKSKFPNLGKLVCGSYV